MEAAAAVQAEKILLEEEGDDRGSEPLHSRLTLPSILGGFSRRLLLVTLVGAASFGCAGTASKYVERDETEAKRDCYKQRVPVYANSGDPPGIPPPIQGTGNQQEMRNRLKERKLKAKDFFDITYEIAYHHKKDPKANMEALMKSALKDKYRTWYMPEIFGILLAQNDIFEQTLPHLEAFPECHHIHYIRLQNGQILFLDKNQNEIFRVDISNVFLFHEEMEFKYGLVDDWTLKRREQLRRRDTIEEAR